MTERTFTLNDITAAAAAPLAKARQQANVDRALDLFAQGLIDALKALPEEPVAYRMSEVGLDPARGFYAQREGEERVYAPDPAPSIYHGRLPQPDPDGSE